jgi:uncharacterized protein YggT (Ycf19 family)
MNAVGIVLYVLYRILYAYYFLMIATVLLGWTPLMHTGVYRLLAKITGVYLDHFVGRLVYRAVDFTPFLGLVLFQLVLLVIEWGLF